MSDIFDRLTDDESVAGDVFDRVAVRKPQSVAEAARERLRARGVNPDVPVDADLNRAIAMAAPNRKPSSSTEAVPSTWGASRAAQAHGMMDLLEGAGKGVIETATTLGRMPWWTGNPIGQIPVVKKFVNDPDLQTALEPENAPQKIGKFGERVGEFVVGGGAANAIAKSTPWLARLTAASPRITNVLQNAVIGGAVTGAQGGDPMVGAAAGGALAAAGEAVGPLARALVESAKKSYMRALGATKVATKNMSTRAVEGYDVAGERVPGLIERGTVAVTRKGIGAKAAKEVEALGDQIDALWSSIPPGEKVPAAEIKSALAQAKSELQQVGPPKSMTVKMADVLPTDNVVSLNAAKGVASVTRSATVDIEPAAVRNLDRVQKLIESLTDDGGLVDVHQLRRVKQVFDGVVAGRGGYAGKQLSIADQGGVLARQEAANAIREQLASAYPDIAAINREFHFWKTVGSVIDETLKRTAPQSQPMGQQLARVAGAAAAGHTGAGTALLVGESASMFRKLTTSAAWNTTSAIAKDRLAQMLAGGQTKGAELLMRSMLAGTSIGTRESQGGTAVQSVADRYFGGNIAAAEKYLRSKGAL